jgi:hypothetical protein
MKKIIILFCFILFIPFMDIIKAEGTCAMTCTDTKIAIAATPCSVCTFSTWYIACDGKKVFCPGHQEETIIFE